jgi:flagellar biosynthesis component FlhA
MLGPVSATQAPHNEPIMEAILMKLVGVISTAVLSLALGVAAPAFAQNQHEQEEEKAKPAENEKRGQPAKVAKQEEKKPQEEKNTKPEEKNAKQEQPRTQQAKPQQQQQHANGGRIPADRYKANFGSGHTFRVSQGDYNNHRFQYGGYSFGFVGIWPGNWLYTQNVYVIEINGVYYLCNPMYPGVNLELSFAL